MKLTKNIMGITSTLVLVILLTQSRLFDFLTETPLGRMVLLAFVIFISYTNHILGLLAVLVIIIGFNQHDMNIYEGVSNRRINMPKVKIPKPVTTVVDEEIKDKEKIIELEKKLMEIKAAKETETAASKEGFCMAEKELTMLRGKQSNSIPVFNKSREQEEGVSPSDKSIFKNLFSEF
jgi:hypothetical protein